MTKRYVFSTLLFAAMAAWAGAQPGTTKPRPDQMLQLVQRNQNLYKKLVGGSLTLAKMSSSPLARSESYDAVIRELEEEIKRAAQAGEAGRVAELTRHMTDVLEKGLTPNLQKARKLISEGSPDEKKLLDLRGLTQRMTGELGQEIAKSSVANSAKVKELLEALEAARQKVEKAVEPPAGQ